MILALLPAAAQEIKLPAALDKLGAKAVDSVDINLDATMLRLAARFLSGKDPDEAKVKRLAEGLKGISVKSFEFERDGEYKDSDLDELRTQLRGPGWSRIVGVRSRRQSGDAHNADIYIRTDSVGINGMVVLVAEPRELTIVSILGSISPDDLRDLSGHFGIPRLDGVSPKKGSKEE
jgi:hypothetical protein